MENNLTDNNTYTLIQRNPINKILEDPKRIFKQWLQNEYITVHIHSQLNATNAILQRAYGLPKIHKAECPLRTIVSSVGSPLHNLATFLMSILRESFSVPVDSYKNSIELVKKLNNIHIPADHCLVSLDVISLFTNVPIDLVLNSIERNWQLIELQRYLSKNLWTPLISY